MDQTSNNKRIAKNTMMLYIRMLLSMVVSLYTSRVVLEVLGVEDYGIYGVVGGVVAMFSFLNASMAGATSRFLTFEMGKGDAQRLRDTFSSALIIHIGIALVVLLLAETVGMWFLNNKLVIPEARMGAAHWVYQLSILGMVVSVTQVPYNASIIAHEKMDIYAYIELLHVLLKLGIVFLLKIGNFDRLVLYALLVLIVNVLIAGAYRFYCVRHYEESHFRFQFNKDISKGILSFSLYNLLGNMGWVVNAQGTTFVINMFFGVVYNAAASIGTTITSVVSGFSANILTAFRPQVTKTYAQGDIHQFQSLLLWALKAMLLVYALIAIPVGITIKELLALWLVEVPPCADIFCQLLLITIFFETLRNVIVMGIHATGRVRNVSLFSGISFMLNPFIIYVLYRFGLPVSVAYVSVIFVNIFLCVVDIFILYHNVRNLSIKDFILSIFKVVFVVLVSIFTLHWVSQFYTSIKLVNIIGVASISSLLLGLLSYYIVLNNIQRLMVVDFIRKKLQKRNLVK